MTGAIPTPHQIAQQAQVHYRRAAIACVERTDAETMREVDAWASLAYAAAYALAVANPDMPAIDIFNIAGDLIADAIHADPIAAG